MPGRISVVVPIYNVEQYVEICLQSIAAQSFADFEVILVDDGSTDGSAAIAERFAARDPRFRLVTKPNGGLGAARNTGVEHATGEFLTFVDSDDLLRRHAYELMINALDETDSDIVSGNVRRLSVFGTRQTRFLAKTFQTTRLATHVTEFPPLLADRVAYNKLWRRSFYDQHDLKFPEGTLYEDTPMTVPAHFLAKSVDVLDETVYLWRIRSGDSQSITQRRAETRGLRDRAEGCRHVSLFLAHNGFDEGKRLYDRTVVAEDLAHFLGVLDVADTEFRELFFDLSNTFLDEAAPDVTDGLTSIERLKWQLVRNRDLDGILDVLDSDRHPRVTRRAPVKEGGSFYGDYPFRNDPVKAIPAEVYRLDDELSLKWWIQRLAWEGNLLHLEGHAHISPLAADEPDAQPLQMYAVGPHGRTVKLTTERVRRPDVTSASPAEVSLDWSGYRATLDLTPTEEDFRPVGTWQIECEVRAGGFIRRSLRPQSVGLFPLLPAARPGGQHRRVTAYLTSDRKLVVSARTERTVINRCDLVDGVLQLEGDLGGVGDATLVLSRRTGAVSLTYPVFVDDTGGSATFLARVPISDLVSELDLVDLVANTERTAGGVVWDPRLGGRRVTLSVDLAEPRFIEHGRQISLTRTSFGNASIVERSLAHVVDSVEWRPGERLRLTGRYEGEPAGDELLLECRGRAEQHAVAISHDTSRSRFTVELAPGRMPTMAGELPLQRGVYEFLVRRYEAGVPAITSLSLDHRSLSALPQEREIAGKSFAVGAWAYDDLVLQVGSPRGGDHAGGHHQRRLQAGYRRGRVRAPLRDAVIYDGRHLGPYAGNLRALHEELVRREAPVEHLWVVTDDAWAVPDTARVLPAETAAYYDAYASARFLLAEGRWPEWYTRRPDQVSIQTGYASPVKLVGADVADRPRLTRDLRRWARQDASKTLHAVSAGPFATGILSRVLALANGGELLETGAPAHDLMVSIDRAEVRSRLGLAPDQVVVLFAPTYRDNLRAPGGYWMGPTPDLESMRAALGEDHLVLMRKHWSVVDPVPFDHTGFVRDVSRYPDVSDLLVAADVVVSDYSSLMVQQAAAGRPTVLYTPDLDGFRNDVRGLYIDDGLELPGPVVSTTEQLVRTIQERRALEDDYRSAVTRFASLFCPLADGKAASRVVDRLIG